MSTTASPAAEPQNIERVLAQLDALPSLSPVVSKLLELTTNDRSDAQQVVRVIESDPPLVARLLSLVGRSVHGVRTEGMTLSNAVVLLGFDAVRHAALCMKVIEVFGPAGASGGAVDRREFWKHCLGVACAARGIASELPGSLSIEDAFICGLLHDLGKVALHAALPKSFEKIARQADRDRSDIAEVERALLGVDHTVVGHRLAERWRLPQRIIDCVWLHHQEPEALPPSIAAGRHVQIVQLADALARERRIGWSGNHRVAIDSRELAQRLGLPEERRRAIVDSLAEEIEARARWLGMDDLSSREVYLRALSAATDELGAVNVRLHEDKRRLERKVAYFTALGRLNETVSPQAPVHQVCAHAAEALRAALDVPSVRVFTALPIRKWVDIGVAGDAAHSDIIDPIAPADDLRRVTDAAAGLAAAGTWIAPPDRVFDALVDWPGGQESDAPAWLLPIVRENRWVGGALFRAESEKVAALRGEHGEITALVAALGLALSQAEAQAAALALGEELALANRRAAALRDELLRGRTLESIAAVAAGAAHELNNPLTVISGRAQMLRAQVDDSDVRAMLDAIVTQAATASRIVTELMEFAKPRSPAPRALDLRAALETLRGEFDSTGVAAASEITLECASDLSKVLFDPEQLTGTFREILKNAVEATASPARRITIKVAPDPTENTVSAEVADNGVGMTSETAEHACDPFFSHRTAGRGRGLGLARAQQWLRLNGGSIRIESLPGAGTRVTVRLRAAPASA